MQGGESPCDLFRNFPLQSVVAGTGLGVRPVFVASAGTPLAPRWHPRRSKMTAGAWYLIGLKRSGSYLARQRSWRSGVFRALETHRVRMFVRLMRHLPSDPRCAVCRAPYGGLGGRIMVRLSFAPSRKNPRLCSECFERAPMGGVEMGVGILFADVRGFTSLAERQAPDAVATLLNRFYASAVDVLCEHAIIDKLVGDQVMAPTSHASSPASPHTTWSPTRGRCWPPRATARTGHG